MVPQILAMVLTVSASAVQTQAPAPRPRFDAFEAATIKPVDPGPKAGRYIIMQGADTFLAKNYTLELLIAAAYELNPRMILSVPSWAGSAHFDIVARTPGEVRPTHEEQMQMLRSLLADRFKLTFHRRQKAMSIYELEVERDGLRMKPSAEAPDELPAVISTVYPDHITLPARNVSMGDFASLLQRAVLDRPVVDKTGLTGRFDFDLTWAPDASQFGGEVPVAPADATSPPLFTAIREQLGLRLEATKGPVEVLVIDSAQPPSPN
ncbi:MAG: TIGR03435 family protein [Terracidiphilus sp.]